MPLQMLDVTKIEIESNGRNAIFTDTAGDRWRVAVSAQKLRPLPKPAPTVPKKVAAPKPAPKKDKNES